MLADTPCGSTPGGFSSTLGILHKAPPRLGIRKMDETTGTDNEVLIN